MSLGWCVVCMHLCCVISTLRRWRLSIIMSVWMVYGWDGVDGWRVCACLEVALSVRGVCAVMHVYIHSYTHTTYSYTYTLPHPPLLRIQQILTHTQTHLILTLYSTASYTYVIHIHISYHRSCNPPRTRLPMSHYSPPRHTLPCHAGDSGCNR